MHRVSNLNFVHNVDSVYNCLRNPAVQTKVSICDTVWADEIDKAVDRFGWSFEQFFFHM